MTPTTGRIEQIETLQQQAIENFGLGIAWLSWRGLALLCGLPAIALALYGAGREDAAYGVAGSWAAVMLFFLSHVVTMERQMRALDKARRAH